MKSIIPFVVRIIASFLAVISNYILAKHLGIAVFGIYSGMLSVVFIINLITDWGFNSYGSQMLAQQQDSSAKSMFVTNALSFKFTLSISFSIFYVVFCLIRFGDNWYYLLGTPLILFSFLNPEWICRGILKPQMASYRQLMFAALNILFFAAASFLHLPKLIIFVLYSFNTISSFAIILFFIKKHLPFTLNAKKNIHISRKDMLKSTSMYFYGYLVNNVNYTAGIIVLTIFSIPESVGQYSSYYNIFSTVVSPIVIVYSLFAPKRIELSNAQFFNGYYKTLINVLAIGVIFYINGAVLYKLFYPKNFIFNYNINALAGGVFVMYCLENMFAVNAIFSNEPKIYFRINVLGLVANTLCFGYLITTKQLSAQSGFASLLISQIVMFCASLYNYKNLLKYLLNKEVLTVALLILTLVAVLFIGIAILVYILSGIILIALSLRTFFLIKNLY